MVRGGNFNPKHALRFGLRIEDEGAGHVEKVSCLFCIEYGREENPGSKRKRTTNIKHFKPPFRTDCFQRHAAVQHCELWKQYSALGDDGKSKFFKSPFSKVLRREIQASDGETDVGDVVQDMVKTRFNPTKQEQRKLELEVEIKEAQLKRLQQESQLFEIERRTKLLLARKQLLDSGVRLDEVNQMLPIE